MPEDRTRTAWKREALELAETLGGRLRQRIARNFVALVLMGSIPRGDHVPGYSGLNLFLVVRRPRSLRHAVVRGVIASQRRAYPLFFNRYGALVSITIIDPEALLAPRSPGSRGLLDSINRREIRTTGVVVVGEDVLGRIPEEAIRYEDIAALHAKYQAVLQDLHPESFFGRMTIIKAVLHMGRAAVLAQGVWVVSKADILREFRTRWPRPAKVLEQALVLRESWDMVQSNVPTFVRLKRDAVAFAEEVGLLLKGLPPRPSASPS